MSDYLFTSESVSEGHPDKVADKISDSILDAILAQDVNARVAAETMVSTGLIVLAGEISSNAKLNYAKVAREVVKEIGYNSSGAGFNAEDCAVMVCYDEQSADIAQGVNEGSGLDANQGAGDQGLMFGYACDETPTLMPFCIAYAHKLMQRQAALRKSGVYPWLQPDAKAQITAIYDAQTGQVKGIDNIVLSTQHTEAVNYQTIREVVIEEIIKAVIPNHMLLGMNNKDYKINPTGRFVIGGPKGDCGLTGRKIIVDTYGGAAPHGGGAFSGKDATKVDRSASYVGRYIAKNIVAAGIAKECQIQLSYTIGCAEPNSISIDTFGSINEKIKTRLTELDLIAIVKTYFDLTPKGIIAMLDLRRPIFAKTVNYGHFGREEPEFTWEKTDKIEVLKNATGL